MPVRRLIAAICAALALPFLPVPPSVAAGSPGPMVIHGTVTGPGGQIIPDAYIEVYGRQGVSGFGADATGHFTYGPLAAGDYRVRASGRTSLAPEFHENATTLEQATVIRVTDGAVLGAVDIELNEGGRIEGRLTGPGGVPAPNLVAQAYRHNPDSVTAPWEHFGNALADATGFYSITGLPDGDYRVHFNDQTFPAKYMSEIYDNDTETILTVVGGATVAGIDGELAEGGHIVGRITGPGGAPASGYATAYDAATGNQFGRDYADSRGNYDLQGLTSGNYKVYFQSNDNSHLPEYFQDASTLADAEIVPVTLGATTTRHAELAPASWIIGKAVGPDGSALANIRVDVWRHTPRNVEPWQSWEQTGTETDGTFRMGGLPEGTYRLEFGDRFQAYSQEFYPDKDTLLEAVDLTVGANETVALPTVVELDLAGRISGTVTAPEGTEPRVLAHRQFGSEWRLVDSRGVDPSGSYEMIGLRAGTFRVEFNDPTTNLSRYWAGSPTFDRATEIVVGAGAEVTGVDGTLIEAPATPTPATPSPSPSPTLPPTPVPVPSVRTLAALTLPRIMGVAKVGRTLKVTSGRWSTQTVIRKIHWLANGRVIKKATRSRFALAAKQRGKKITVRVTASAAGYLPVTVTTKPTARVTTRPSIEAVAMARARTEPAASGRITGSVKPVPKSRQSLFAAQARISRLDVPGSLITSTVSRRGTFAAKVPAGLYAVVGVGHGAKKPAARVDVLRVRAGKTVTMGGRAAASSSPQPIRISVGTFTNRTVGTGADGAYFVAGLSDLSLSDLILSTEDCRSDVGIFEDRQGPRWNEILGELKFQTSKYVDADTRRKARAALKNLPKYAPTHRVTATVTAVSSAGARADFRLVNLKSGRIEWSHAVTVAGDPFGVADQAMDILAEELCAPPGPATPQTLTGTFSGSVVTSRYTLSWTGTLAKEFLAKDPHTGFLYRDSAHYRTTNAAVTWKAEGTCNGSGTLGNTELLNAFPDTTIAWNRTTPGWGYVTFLSPNAGTQMMVQCPQTGDHPPPPENAAYLVGLGGEGALLYNSDSRGAEANRFSPDLTAFDGTLSINAGNPQTWAWDLTGAGVAEVPEQ